METKNNKLNRMGRKLNYQYHIIQQAWNCYGRLVEINYEENFSCSICKNQPSIIILDGIAMGTTRQLPDISNNVDTEQIFPILSLAERLFVGESQLRDKLKHYTKFGLIHSKFDCLLSDLQMPEFASYLSVTSKVHRALKILHYMVLHMLSNY